MSPVPEIVPHVTGGKPWCRVVTRPISSTSKGQRQDSNLGPRGSETCAHPPTLPFLRFVTPPMGSWSSSQLPWVPLPGSPALQPPRGGEGPAVQGRGNEKDRLLQVSRGSACPAWASRESWGQRRASWRAWVWPGRKSTTVA